MKLSLLIGSMMLVLSALASGQLLPISNDYKGDPLIRSEKNFLGIENNCSNFDESGEYKAAGRAQCLLDNFDFDFERVYSISENKNQIIYEGDYQLEISREGINYIFNGNEYLGSQILLSLIKNDTVSEAIVLASSYTNETSFASVGHQYYYISDEGDIYTFLVTTVEEGDFPLLWKHYSINAGTAQFDLKKMLILIPILYEITYPDQLEISRPLTPSVPNVLKTPEEFNSCLDYIYCAVDAYHYYSNKLQELTSEDEYVAIEKTNNSICLNKESPSHFNEVDSYIDELMNCLIEQTKQSLTQTSH